MVDAKNNPGIVALDKACDTAIETAKIQGFAVAGTKNSLSTSGSLSYFLKKIAENNLIGIVMARSGQILAPFKSKKPLIGTNPIGFAIPSEDQPLIFDMGATEISYGEVIKANTEGTPIPENTSLDSEGNLTTNPAEVLNKGSLLPFADSYKSSGLALMVEILSGIFPQAGYMDENTGLWGNIVFAFKPDLLIDTDEFKRKVMDMKNKLKNEDTRDGSKVRLPGENTLKIFMENSQKDSIEIDEKVIESLRNYKSSE